MLSYSVHGSLSGSVNAPVSKSDLHRLIIACSLSGSDTEICRCTLSEDIKATARVMEAIGASIHFEENRILVEGIKLQPDTNVLCDCSESGSTLRFLVPVLAALGQNATFTGHGRLAKRPMEPLLSSIYGTISLTTLSTRRGEKRLIMIKEDDAC